MLHRITVLLLFVLAGFSLQAQTYQEVEASRFDYGRMWTFEHPPLDYFEETYGFRPDASWLEKARMSSLRFANWCSASFISPDGLILTNHHCSRGVVGQVMKAGENFDENGFFAASRAEERQVPGLFVKQLVKMEDVTNRVVPLVEATTSAEEMQQVRQQTLEKLIGEYQSNPEWAGLEIEPVVYYNGGRYSDPEVDGLIEKSATIIDADERLEILHEITQMALIEDQNIVPLHYQVDLYAFGKQVSFEPRADTYLYFYDMDIEE